MKQSILHDGVDSAMNNCPAGLRQIMPPEFQALTDACSPRSRSPSEKKPAQLAATRAKTEMTADWPVPAGTGQCWYAPMSKPVLAVRARPSMSVAGA
jgi:hypothetical protein